MARRAETPNQVAARTTNTRAAVRKAFAYRLQHQRSNNTAAG